MRKEVLAAIITGIIVGIVVAFGVWRANIALKPSDETSLAEASPTPEQSATVLGLTIAKPEQNRVITESPVTLSGITKANSWVAISAEDDDYFIRAGDNGEFSESVELIGGVNQLIITSFDEEGEESTEALTLVYSTEFSKAEVAKESNDTSLTVTKEPEDGVSEKVQEKIEKAIKAPLAYLGTITDIADTTVQTKTVDGEIKQVSMLEKTEFVKINKTTKVIEYSDVAIGDFIVAMGYVNSNEVLEASRVLVTEVLESTDRNSFYGVISEIDKGNLTVKSPREEAVKAESVNKATIYKIDEDGKLTKIKYTNIDEGDTIILTGTTPKPAVLARTILVVKEAEEPEESPSPTPEQ